MYTFYEWDYSCSLSTHQNYQYKNQASFIFSLKSQSWLFFLMVLFITSSIANRIIMWFFVVFIQQSKRVGYWRQCAKCEAGYSEGLRRVTCYPCHNKWKVTFLWNSSSHENCPFSTDMPILFILMNKIDFRLIVLSVREKQDNTNFKRIYYWLEYETTTLPRWRNWSYNKHTIVIIYWVGQ